MPARGKWHYKVVSVVALQEPSKAIDICWGVE